MLSITITKNDENQRLDKFLSKAFPLLPQSMIYKGIRNKRIKINNARCEASTKLREGNVLSLYINDEFLKKSEDLSFLDVKPDITAVYEDENILILHKPSGLLVHEDENNECDTLINRALRYLHDKGEYTAEDMAFCPALCNRLDRGTEGLVICAKNAEALRFINEKIKNREVVKKYLCIVHGSPPRDAEVMTAYLKKDENRKLVSVSRTKLPGYKTIITGYRIVHKTAEYAILDVDLKTGRTHQIRAHLAHAGMPIVGDGKYGRGDKNKMCGITRQALCAYSLTFNFADAADSWQYLNGKRVELDKKQILTAYKEQIAGRSAAN